MVGEPEVHDFQKWYQTLSVHSNLDTFAPMPRTQEFIEFCVNGRNEKSGKWAPGLC